MDSPPERKRPPSLSSARRSYGTFGFIEARAAAHKWFQDSDRGITGDKNEPRGGNGPRSATLCR
jgi:hypothetical protein